MTMATADEKTTGVASVRAVQRALAVLRAFEGRKPQSLAEITAATGLDKGTTRRLLLTLLAEGFVAHDPAAQRYRLGHAVRALADGMADRLDLRTAAVPVLSDLAADLHITAFLSVFEDGQAVCLERVHDMKGMEVRWWTVGGSLPVNCGGAPKLLLAHQHPAEIDRVLNAPLMSLTPRSLVDTAAFRASLDVIKGRGWELAIDDVVVGLTALAVPIRSPTGDLVCAVSIAGLTPQMVEDGRPVHLARLQDAAQLITSRIAAAR
jgi:DNA-binding IclR family transcriptional regulator